MNGGVFPSFSQSNSLIGVPCRSPFVVRKRGNCRQDYLLEKICQFALALPSRQTAHAEAQFMPGDTRHGAASAVFSEVLQDALVRVLLNRARNRARVE